MAPQAGGGGGMSRAAKKRAKKKQKQQQPSLPKDEQELENVVVPQKQLFDDDEDDNDNDVLLRKVSSKKRKKRKSPLEEKKNDTQKSLNKKKKKKKSSPQNMKKLPVDDNDDNDESDRDNVEMEMDGQMESDDNDGDDDVSPSAAKGELQNDNDDSNNNDNDDDDDDDDGEDDIDQVVQDMVSMLSPSTILMLNNNNNDDEHDAHILHMAKEQLSGIDLCQDVLPEMSSKIRAKCLLNSLLSPAQLTAEQFYETYWEKQPLVIQASSSSSQQQDNIGTTQRHLHGFLSLQSIQTLLDKEPMCYGRDLNVTRYEDTTGSGTKRRITLDLLKGHDDNNTNNGDGISGEDDNFVLCDSKDVWSNYQDMGATLRFLCPHKHVDSIHALLSTLELEFGCMVGANAYLTPPGESQGFAPHYDDIEAFVLQLEGSKHWKVYSPLSKGETLPRQSSTDYTEEQLKDVEPTLDVVLQPGDILYMPRGWIHQATTLPSTSSSIQKKQGHSLHLTVSAMQNWAWSDLLEILLPEALEATSQSTTSTSLRQGLPRNFLEYMGAIHETTSSNEDLPEGLKQAAEAHADNDGDDGEDKEERLAKKRKLQQQEQFREEAKKRIMRVCKEAMSMIDAGCDQIGKRFLSDRLPPALFAQNELSFTSESKDNAAALATGGKVWPNTMCRLVRPGIARLALEDNKAVLYHCVDNSRVYHGNPLSPMEFELDDAPALEMLMTTVEPHWISVQDLIHDDIEDKMDIAQSLYDEGILSIVQTETPDRSVQTG